MGKVVDYINSNYDIGEEYYRIFGKQIPNGKMFCPFHNNVNTPSAKRYGNVIHCFSCRKSYTTYDLLKKYNSERIDEIKQSTVIEEVSEIKEQGFKIKRIDRSKPIESVISFILS